MNKQSLEQCRAHVNMRPSLYEKAKLFPPNPTRPLNTRVSLVIWLYPLKWPALRKPPVTQGRFKCLSTPLHHGDPCPLLQRDRFPLPSQDSAHSCGDFQLFSSVGAVSLDTSVGGGGWGNLNHYDVGASDTLSMGSCD